MSTIQTNHTEQELRAEIEALKQQLKHAATGHGHGAPAHSGPSGALLVGLAVLLAGLLVAGYFLGYLPRQRREQVLAEEASQAVQTLPVVNVRPVERAAPRNSLLLPGNIQAISEAPVMARASGYLRKRYVDIGDRVKEGQVLAEIEGPELKQQIRQAEAALDQANSSVQQAEAALVQGRANESLAKVTAQRWNNLQTKGAVSRQETDTRQSQYDAQQANTVALERAVSAARSNSEAAKANLARLNDLVSYQTVRAPFAGVITVRNVDAGALVNEGNTLLFRIAQTDRLRTYINVPQSDAGSVRPGQEAKLRIPGLSNREFPGSVTHVASALDPASRTMLVEVQAPNPSGVLLPGTFAHVTLVVPRQEPPLLIPGDTLVVRADGPQVAVVSADGVVHYARVDLGRDFGDKLEVLGGLTEGQMLAVNPSDVVREGAKVKPARAPEKKNN